MSNVSYDNQSSSLGVLRNPKHKSTGKINFASNASASKVKSSQSLHRLQPGDNPSGNVSVDLTNMNQQLQSSPNLRGV